MNITATHKINGSLEYEKCPKIPYNEGKEVRIDEYWKLSIDGNLQEVYVTHLKIENIDIEYVVNEREFYIHYHVAHYKHNHKIKVEKLTLEDIAPYFG